MFNLLLSPDGGKAAIVEAAAGIIVVHNHPSGDPTLSADDREVTRQLLEAGRLLDRPVYHDVVVGGELLPGLCGGGAPVSRSDHSQRIKSVTS